MSTWACETDSFFFFSSLWDIIINLLRRKEIEIARTLYQILREFDEEEVEVTILNVMEDEKGIERFYPVKDEETLSAIFDIFEAKFEGEIEFVD